MKILAFDTEDDSRGNPLLINFFDGEKHFTFTDNRKAWEWIAKQGPSHVWACNAEYDLLNIFQEWTATVLTLQYVASGLMRATMDEADITFFDTLRHWPLGVSAMGEFIGKPKHKDYLSSKVTPKLISACKRDTEIVFDFVKIMLSKYDRLGLQIKSTLPSMAAQYWKKDFYPKPLPFIQREYRESFRSGYYGGRVEVFRFGKIKGPIYHYDINSLYPFVMRENPYPDIHGSSQYTNDPDFNLFGMANICIDLPLHKIPGLPYRTEKEIIFPYGKMTGTYCYPEIRQALSDGGKIRAVNWAIEYQNGIDPFSGYVDTCYANRLASSTDLEKTFWKLFMNSLYGKFGSKDSLLTISNDKEFEIVSASRLSNVIWAAYVTCYARLELLKHLRNVSTVFYTDTDSIFTPDEMKTSRNLGALKLEGVYSKAEFFGNKVYVVNYTYRARGIPRKKSGSENDPAKDFIRSGRCIFRRPARLRESRRSFSIANVWYRTEKRFRAEYTKRIILTNGETKPFTLAKYKV